jgi:hypothetical protein
MDSKACCAREKGFIKVSLILRQARQFPKSVTVSPMLKCPDYTQDRRGSEPRAKTIAELYPRQIGPVRARSNHVNFGTIKQKEVLTDTLEIVLIPVHPFVWTSGLRLPI